MESLILYIKQREEITDRVNIINKIIAGNSQTKLEDEISILIARASIEITKETDINNP